MPLMLPSPRPHRRSCPSSLGQPSPATAAAVSLAEIAAAARGVVIVQPLLLSAFAAAQLSLGQPQFTVRQPRDGPEQLRLDKFFTFRYVLSQFSINCSVVYSHIDVLIP